MSERQVLYSGYHQATVKSSLELQSHQKLGQGRTCLPAHSECWQNPFPGVRRPSAWLLGEATMESP